ncbi:MAG TPA: hypothetical protein VN719_15315, partial [Gemmatimonadales bacterium]|nr:hypothetical protein [Gemmatimonadales bacterium]
MSIDPWQGAAEWQAQREGSYEQQALKYVVEWYEKGSYRELQQEARGRLGADGEPSFELFHELRPGLGVRYCTARPRAAQMTLK